MARADWLQHNQPDTSDTLFHGSTHDTKLAWELVHGLNTQDGQVFIMLPCWALQWLFGLVSKHRGGISLSSA